MSADPVTIRLPRTSYLIVVFLVVGAIPVAFGASGSSGIDETTRGGGIGGTGISLLSLVLLVPILVAVFIARTRTVVSEDGLRIGALFGSRTLPWDAVRGLSVSGRAVYAVVADGAVRLPCVRLAHLSAISRASGGRLPELDDPTPKPAPARRRRG